MKKFILRSILFVTMTLFAYAGIYCYCNVRNIFDLIAVLDCEVLSTCNSHEQCAIDPVVFKKYGNFNSIGSQPWVWEAKLRMLLETDRCHPKIVLIDRGSHELLWGYSADDVAQLVARFLPLEIRYKTCPFPIDWTLVLHYAVGSRSFNTVWAARPPKLRPQGAPFDVAGRVREHFAGKCLPDGRTLALMVSSLEHLIELAKANGIEPILITTPKHRDYLSAVPPDVDALNRQVTKHLQNKYSIRYLDYSGLQLERECFGDADHLNQNGRTLFTKVLMRDLGFAAEGEQ